MVKLVNRAKMTVASGGASDITLGTAVDGYQTFAAAGVTDQNQLRYTITDGDDWEIGIGTYTASGTTLVRTVTESSNSGNALTCSADAVIFVTMAAEDFAGNTAPIWLTTPVTAAYLTNDGSALTLTGQAIDDGGYPVVYSWDGYSGTSIYSDSSLPPQLASAPTFNGGTASLIGSSSSANKGSFNFRLLASDGINSAATTTLLTLDFPFVITGSQTQQSGAFWAGSKQNIPTDMTMSPSGTELFVVGRNSSNLAQWTLSTSTPFSLPSASFTADFSLSAKETEPEVIKFSSDGLTMFTAGNVSHQVHQYLLSSPFSISSTPTFVASFTPSVNANIEAMCWNEDGSRFFLMQGTTIYQYSCSSPFDISGSSATYSNLSFSTTSQSTSPKCVLFNNNGSKMFVGGGSSVKQYRTLAASPWSLDGLTYDNVSLNVGTSLQGMFITPDQSELFLVTSVNDIVYRYA